MKIYLDVFFIINFLMNVLIFAIMNCYLKRKPVNIRSISASAVGAIGAVIIILGGIKNLFVIYIIMYIFVSCLMIRISFGKTTLRGMITYIAGYYIVAIFTAGTSMITKEIVGLQDVSLIHLLLTAVLLLFFAQKIRYKNHGISHEQSIFSVKISYNENTVRGTAFLDTGNNLYEPVSHKSVSVVEFKLFEKLLSGEQKKDFYKAIHNQDTQMLGKLLLRYIPFHSLGKENDFLLGVLVNDLEVEINDKKSIHTGETWIGLYDGFLSSDSGYEMLLNSRLFEK